MGEQHGLFRWPCRAGEARQPLQYYCTRTGNHRSSTRSETKGRCTEISFFGGVRIVERTNANITESSVSACSCLCPTAQFAQVIHRVTSTPRSGARASTYFRLRDWTPAVGLRRTGTWDNHSP